MELIVRDESVEYLSQAVYQTVRYGDIFDQPVIATNVWSALLTPSAAGVDVPKIHGGAPTLRDVHSALAALVTAGKLGTSQGYYFLPGREELVLERARRFWLAQDKWRATRRVARALALVPFVRMLAMSGSLAIGNTRKQSDLDVFVVVECGHIWTTRLLVMLVTQLLGVRRKYWDRQAPDKVCLNHYLTNNALVIAPEIRNVYTAMLYRHLVPLYGLSVARDFARANEAWTRPLLTPGTSPHLASVHAVSLSKLLRRVKHLVEQLLQEPLLWWLESTAEYLQRRIIRRHTKADEPGRVFLSDTELAFHPRTKVPTLLKRFAA